MDADSYIDQVRSLFLDKTFADVNIEVEDQVFPAHRCVLAARCKFFLNMFTSYPFIVVLAYNLY